MEVKASLVHDPIYHRGWVHSRIGCSEGSHLAASTVSRLLGERTTRPSSTCDSQSTIHLIRNPVYHAKTKHIEVRFHHIRELVTEKTLEVRKIDIEVNIADSLTKPLLEQRFGALRTSDRVGQIQMMSKRYVQDRTGKLAEIRTPKSEQPTEIWTDSDITPACSTKCQKPIITNLDQNYNPSLCGR